MSTQGPFPAASTCLAAAGVMAVLMRAVEASRAAYGSLCGRIRVVTLPDARAISLCTQNC
jgi:ferric-dicitrate binding protein FerR (iron transport regulator)